jgi:hypothetical protein
LATGNFFDEAAAATNNVRPMIALPLLMLCVA